MSLTKGTIPQRLAETLILDKTADSTPSNNVFVGVTLADKIYSVKIDNSGINAVSYVKGQFATTYTTNNSPIVRWYAPANSIVEYVFPKGWPTGGMSTGFSFVGTSTDASTGTQADPISPGTLKVTLLAGT